LGDSARDTDIVARYGGEEFVIVMPQTDLAGASVFSERLRYIVADRLTITVSGGVTMAVEGDTPESLIARADAALYSAKDAGRNRVFCRSGDSTLPVASERGEHQKSLWNDESEQVPACAPPPSA
jgi:diguanylate cyclase (GGDEF)-like protein